MFLLIVQNGRLYTLHSIHKTREFAECWMECKEHDGAQAEIVEVDAEGFDELERFIEENPKNTTKKIS